MPEKEGDILWGLIVLLSTLALCPLLKSIFRCSADWRYVQRGLAGWAAAWAVALANFWLCWRCTRRVLHKLFEVAFTTLDCVGLALIVGRVLRLVF